MGSVYRIDGPGFGSWKNPEALTRRVRHTGCFRGAVGVVEGTQELEKELIRGGKSALCSLES